VKGDSAPSLLGCLLLCEPWGGAGSSKYGAFGCDAVLGVCCRKERKDGAMQGYRILSLSGSSSTPPGKVWDIHAVVVFNLERALGFFLSPLLWEGGG